MAVGSELLRPGFRESHSNWLAEKLESAGFEVVSLQVVPDDPEAIASSLIQARSSGGLVLVTGGIGPTRDDRTRQALAAVLGRPLRRDPRAESQVREWCRRHRLPCTLAQRQQALVPEGAFSLRNRAGSAPGILVTRGNGALVALPGVFSEMSSMFQALIPKLRHLARSQPVTATLRSAGVGESRIDRRIRGVHARFPRVEVTTLALPGEVTIQLRSRGPGAPGEVERCRRWVARKLRNDLISDTGEVLEKVVFNLLKRRGWRLVAAESCTAGLVSARLARVPGVSSVFAAGAVCYNDRAKERMLSVPRDVLVKHGAVSRPAVLAMARGAAETFGAEVAVAVTGIAGPGGGTAGTPVGTVHWAVVHPEGQTARMRCLAGDRERIRVHAACAALDLVRRTLLGARAGGARHRA